MAKRRGFGEVERRANVTGRVTYRARYAMPDGTRYSRTLATKPTRAHSPPSSTPRPGWQPSDR